MFKIKNKQEEEFNNCIVAAYHVCVFLLSILEMARSVFFIGKCVSVLFNVSSLRWFQMCIHDYYFQVILFICQTKRENWEQYCNQNLCYSYWQFILLFICIIGILIEGAKCNSLNSDNEHLKYSKLFSTRNTLKLE